MHTFGAYVLIFLAARVIASPFARNINGLTVRNGNGTQDQVRHPFPTLESST